MTNTYKIPRESCELDDVARATAPGNFVQLADGVTHYRQAGPDPVTARHRPVVLVHGFSVPGFIWDPTFERLAEAGIPVLCYDLFGRGYSDRPRLSYDLALFDRQLDELIETLSLPVPVDLVGLSMGGAVVVGFADRHPERVRRLALLDPAGFPMKLPLPVRLLHVPLLGEALMGLVGRRILVSGLIRDFRLPEMLPELAPKYLVQMQYKGFLRALLSTVRYGPLQNMTEAYARVGGQGRPVLLIWGREDTMVPFSLSKAARGALPGAEFHAIDGAGHVPHLERPEFVHRLLLDFLTET